MRRAMHAAAGISTCGRSRTASVGAPELMFQHAGLPDPLDGAGFTYDVAPDGRFLVGVPTSGDVPSTPIVVMLNWRFPTSR